jgi:hypothetical protein
MLKKLQLNLKNNRVLVMAGCTPHEVTEIKSKLNETFTGNGRYCNAMFFGLAPEKGRIQNDSN